MVFHGISMMLRFLQASHFNTKTGDGTYRVFRNRLKHIYTTGTFGCCDKMNALKQWWHLISRRKPAWGQEFLCGVLHHQVSAIKLTTKCDLRAKIERKKNVYFKKTFTAHLLLHLNLHYNDVSLFKEAAKPSLWRACPLAHTNASISYSWNFYINRK